MDITWLGDNSFLISDELINVLVNPNDSTLGSSITNDNSLILSTDSHESYSTDLPVVNSPGEF